MLHPMLTIAPLSNIIGAGQVRSVINALAATLFTCQLLISVKYFRQIAFLESHCSAPRSKKFRIFTGGLDA